MEEHNHDIAAEDVARICGQTLNPSILEIGANDGDTTLLLLHAMPSCTVVAFEPDPRALARLRTVLGDNPRERIIDKAVGQINGSVLWYASQIDDLPEGMACWDKSSSMRSPTGHIEVSPEIYFTQDYEVGCVRLDDLDLPPFDFAWIDVQGAQRDVVGGGRRTLDGIKNVYIECHSRPLYDGEPTPEELPGLFPKHRLISRWGSNYLFEKSDCNP